MAQGGVGGEKDKLGEKEDLGRKPCMGGCKILNF